MHEWREWLYPLGYLASVMFGLRFIVQWIQSEKAGKSVVHPSFWKISLIGNLMLMLHTLVQIQFHVSVVQAANAVISWRNLDLMKSDDKRHSLLFTLFVMGLTITSIVAFYMLQSYILPEDFITWFRSPSSEETIHPSWHILGALGLILFNCRFWIQWFDAESFKESRLGLLFWWMSVIGGLFTLTYFIKMGDPVNMLGPGFGMIPYVRNLMLIYKNQRETSPSTSSTVIS